MVIQSRRVWISGQFLEAALKVEDGKIVQIYPYGTVKADVDYGTKRIVPGFMSIPMVPMDLTPMMPKKMVYETG